MHVAQSQHRRTRPRPGHAAARGSLGRETPEEKSRSNGIGSGRGGYEGEGKGRWVMHGALACPDGAAFARRAAHGHELPDQQDGPGRRAAGLGRPPAAARGGRARRGAAHGPLHVDGDAGARGGRARALWPCATRGAFVASSWAASCRRRRGRAGWAHGAGAVRGAATYLLQRRGVVCVYGSRGKQRRWESLRCAG